MSTFIAWSPHCEEKSHRSSDNLEPYLNSTSGTKAALCIPFLSHQQYMHAGLHNRQVADFLSWHSKCSEETREKCFLVFVLIAVELIWVRVSLDRVLVCHWPRTVQYFQNSKKGGIEIIIVQHSWLKYWWRSGSNLRQLSQIRKTGWFSCFKKRM